MADPVLWTVLIGLLEIVGILSAAHAVMSVRTPQGTIAWAVVLVAAPFVAVPAYWVFGRNKFKGYVRARRHKLERLEDAIRRANEQLAACSTVRRASPGVVAATEKLARVPFTGGNRVDLLVDGEATFSSILDGIRAARSYVLVQFYIVRDDALGRRLASELADKARGGVPVHFLYDEIGSFALSHSYLEGLRAAGVEVTPFHSRKGVGNRFQLNFRNHRKTVVVDGRVAWVGGHNVGVEYLGEDPDIGPWHDVHVRLEGPAVIGAQLAFLEDWRWATDNELSCLSWTPRIEDVRAEALVIASGPADPMETALLMFMHAISSASERIWIASPYFVPDDAIVQALQLAALRGVDVRILIPEKADSRWVTLAAYSYFDEVKAAGVAFYRYQAGFLHGKFMLIDDNVATVGTANFDNRSFRLNFEITAVVLDEQFAGEVHRLFEHDFLSSRLMVLGELDAKPLWFRLAVRVARLLAPVL
ncbi:MAG: cardiolipin synthase [Thermoanaerobaculales bacterium]|nr:cardiolipin synthase [Thermoanaerobaculales bacterium]